MAAIQGAGGKRQGPASRFNLTFSGQIQPGRNPEEVKRQLGRLLEIDDPAQLDLIFSGDTVVLRRDLERKPAAEFYSRLQKIGAMAELVKIADQRTGGAAQPAKNASRPASAPSGQATTPATRAPRRADLAADHHLQATDEDQLKAKEQALEEALRARREAQSAPSAAPTSPAAQPSPTQERNRARAARRAQRRQREAAAAAARRADSARREAEKNARREALRAELERAKAEQEQAQQEARRQEQKRLQREAEAEHQRAVEQAARERAEAEERARRAEQERLQREAEAERQRVVEQAARERVEAEARARRAEQERLQREAEAERQRAVEQAARERVEVEARARRAEQERLQREAEAEAEAAHRREVELAARERAEEQARQRQAALERRQQAQERARQRRAEAEADRRRRHRVEQALEPATGPRVAPAAPAAQGRSGVRTRLQLPRRQRSADPGSGHRRRQPGEPNLYSLRPFRNTPAIQARAAQARQAGRIGYGAALAALAGLLLVAGLSLGLRAPQRLAGPEAVTVDAGGRLLLLAGGQLLLHDRAGVAERSLPLPELGVVSLQPPLAFDAGRQLLARGVLQSPEGAATGVEGTTRLLRCDLESNRCTPFTTTLDGGGITALAVHPLDGTVFATDGTDGTLFRFSPDGELLAQAPLALPERPALWLDGGLLLMNSAAGPAISVFRYESDAFGQQLDEILLLPEGAVEAGRERVGDFLRDDEGNWWVTLFNPATGSAGVYRFDGQWQPLGELELKDGSGPRQLVRWGPRVLVNDPRQTGIQRFNASGTPEAPFASTLLQERLAGEQRRADLRAFAWQGALAVFLLLAVTGGFLGWLNRQRSRVYDNFPSRGADPLDELADQIQWVPATPDRALRLRRTGFWLAGLSLGLLAIALGLGLDAVQLGALLLGLAGPWTGLLLLQRIPPGHIGTLPNRLLLVDHSGMYHLGGGERIRYRGRFLMIDDVVVFTGTSVLPAFDPARLQAQLAPLRETGARADWRVLLVRLLQSGHPVVFAAAASLASLGAALAVFALHGMS